MVDDSNTGQASPRDNVVFEAGLFGGVLGMRRTFILHASGAKLPTDLLGLTCVRYDGSATPAEVKAICQKLRNAIANEGAAARIETNRKSLLRLSASGVSGSRRCVRSVR